MATELSSAETRQTTFEQSVAMTLHLWPALSLAVENNWGGYDSAEKRDWFAGVIVDMFPPISDGPIDKNASDITSIEQIEDVETTLVQVMMDEFELVVDDESPYDIAKIVVSLRNQCVSGNFSEAEAVAERFKRKESKASSGIKRVEAPVEDDGSEDSADYEDKDDEDDDMEDAPRLVQIPKENIEPEVDEDGFITVVSKKRQ